jgi:tetratricopeptide (TPR) repeat protein
MRAFDLKGSAGPARVALASALAVCAFAPVRAAEVIQPSDTDNRMVQMAFRDFDLKRFEDSEKEFTLSIQRWKEMNRPRDEIVSLLKARANVRLDNKDFKGSLADCNEALKLMSIDGEKEDGTARYPEYPDTFVARALAQEGLADWSAALQDYDKAVNLWGGGRGDGVNPYVLTFRGNTLGRLNRYDEAILDYEAASNTFNSLRDVARYSDARANLALALYQVGRTDDAVKAMNDVIRKNPGYADMHVAIAADAWSKGNYILALKVC